MVTNIELMCEECPDFPYNLNTMQQETEHKFSVQYTLEVKNRIKFKDLMIATKNLQLIDL